MRIPEGKTEAEVLEAIENAVSILSHKFAFGYYDVDDIKQCGRIYAIELMDKDLYDNRRPLANFIFTHVKNRLINLKRDKFRRADPPCQKCHNGRPCGEDGNNCPAYKRWYQRNQAKSNLVGASPKEPQDPAGDDYDEVQMRDLIQLIDEKLPAEYRADWRRLLEGASLPAKRKEQVRDIVKSILNFEEE